MLTNKEILETVTHVHTKLGMIRPPSLQRDRHAVLAAINELADLQDKLVAAEAERRRIEETGNPGLNEQLANHPLAQANAASWDNAIDYSDPSPEEREAAGEEE